MGEIKSPDTKELAFEDYQKGMKYKDIAQKYNVSLNTVKSWQKRNKWTREKCAPETQKGCTPKRGAQPGNKNATGPPQNKNAEKHGFLTKWLPEETMQIMGAIQSANPLDLLWDNIQLQYTAIIRAQKLMYVRDQEDKTTTKIGEGCSDSGSSKKWEVQQAWDKHATFLNAQSKAMKTFESMIKQYDELLHKNWELATEEQKTRIAVLKVKANLDDNETTEDDGFVEALKGQVDEVWQE